MSATLRSPDRLTLRPALAVRFWDPVTRRRIASGLEVTARRAEGAPADHARPSPSGTWVFHELRGLVAYSRGGPATPRPYVVEVRDPSGAFLPVRFVAEVPATDPLFVPGIGSPPGSPPDGQPEDAVSLYSSPARAVSGVALVRVELRDLGGNPLAWSNVHLTVGDGRLVRGRTDPGGRAVLLFPYPPLDEAIPGSPGAGALHEQRWLVSLKVYAARLDAAHPPDLAAAEHQPEVDALAVASTAEPFAATFLTFGRPLVLRSRPTPTEPELSHVVVASGAP